MMTRGEQVVEILRRRFENKRKLILTLEEGLPGTRDWEKRSEMIRTLRELESEADDIVSTLKAMGEEV